MMVSPDEPMLASSGGDERSTAGPPPGFGSDSRWRVAVDWLATNWKSVATLSVLFLAWLVLTESETISPNRLASPIDVGRAFDRLITEGFAGAGLWDHVYASVERWFVGAALATVVALPFGIALALSNRFRWGVTVSFEILRYIPPFAWVPVAILWFGPGLRAQALVVYIAAFPPIVLNTYTAIKGIDPQLGQAARMLGTGRLRMIRSVIFPTALPAIIVGIRIALGNGWMALMGAELIAGNVGLGFLVIAGQRNTDLAIMMAAMLMIGLLGAGVDLIVNQTGAYLTRWRRGQEVAG